MKNTLISLSANLLAASVLAQNCIPPVGTIIGVGPDTVLPIQAIGFAFPFGGTTYTDIHICDKCYAFLSNAGVPAPLAGGDFTATAAELVGGPPRLCPLWSDIQVLTVNNGHIYLDAQPSHCTVTWENASVYNSGAAGGTIFNMQMTLFPSGEILFSYGGNATNGSIATQVTWQEGIVGVSPGGGAALPAASDMSASPVSATNTVFEQFSGLTSFDLQGTQLLLVPLNPGWVVLPPSSNGCATRLNFGQACTGTSLALNAGGLPYLGNASFALNTSGVPNLVPLGFVFFGDAQLVPGVDLTFLGMPGCQAYTNANLGSFTFNVTLPAGTGSLPLPIPNNPGLIGSSLTAQSVAFSLSTPLNLIISNGTKITLGT